MAKLAEPTSFILFARSWCGVGVLACSTGADCEFCSGRSLVNGNITPLLPSSGQHVAIPLGPGPPRRSKPVPVLKVGRRKLTPNLEQVTCREPRVTPISSAISSRLFPLSTRFRICWILSGVNFVCLPRGSTWAVSSAIISGPSVHLFSVHLFCPRYTCDYSLCCGPDGSTAVLGRAQKNSARPTRKAPPRPRQAF